MTSLADSLVEEVLARLHRKHDRSIVDPVSELASDQQQKMRDALIQSTLGLFSTMCGWKLEQTEISGGSASRRDISGIISMSGRIRATVVVSLDKQLAFSVADAFLGTRPTEIDADVIDLVGELTNMIGGNAKDRFAMEGVNLGLPTVVAGQGHYVAFESGLVRSQLQFHCDIGALNIELGLLAAK